MMSYSSRERVTKSLSHQEPDRVPFDCHFGYLAYKNLMDYLSYPVDETILPTHPGLTVKPSIEFMQEFGIDLYFIGLDKPPDTPHFEYGMDSYTDEWGITYHKIDDGYSFSYQPLSHPLENATVEDLEKFHWPDPYHPSRVDGLRQKCKSLYEETDFALVGRFNTPIFEQAFMLRGFEKFLIDLAINPDFACELMDRLTQIAISLIEVGLEACGPYLQILRLAGDDMGHQQGTILSPDMFRDLIKPRFSRLYGEAKKMFLNINPEGKLMAHTDGDVYQLIPDYIEMGLDVLNPVQPHVTNMDHRQLKREFGDRLSFHGAIDIQRLLPFGTVKEVKREVQATIRNLGQGGGYIVAPTHYLQADVPPENIIALRDAVLEYGNYPLR
jgi:uroporphyrinogen decarboxylase